MHDSAVLADRVYPGAFLRIICPRRRLDASASTSITISLVIFDINTNYIASRYRLAPTALQKDLKIDSYTNLMMIPTVLF